MATTGEIRVLGFEDLGILKDLMRKERFFWGESVDDARTKRSEKSKNQMKFVGIEGLGFVNLGILKDRQRIFRASD